MSKLLLLLLPWVIKLLRVNLLLLLLHLMLLLLLLKMKSLRRRLLVLWVLSKSGRGFTNW